jgi:hypothetical protein
MIALERRPQGGLGGARLLGVAGHARDLHQPDLGDGDPRRRLSTQMAVALLSPHAVRVTGPDSLCARQRQPGRDRTGLERFQRSATAIVSSVSGTRRAERACRSAPDPALRVQRIVQLLCLWKKGVLLEPSNAKYPHDFFISHTSSVRKERRWRVTVKGNDMVLGSGRGGRTGRLVFGAA